MRNTKFPLRLSLGILCASALLIATGYLAFVQWRYAKLPPDRAPATARYTERVQKLYWHTVFGPAPMETHSHPLWKMLLIYPFSDRGIGFSSASFRAVSMASSLALLKRLPEHRPHSLEANLDEVFAAIWVSGNWTTEEVVNTLLDKSYFCHAYFGIEAAARGYFGQEVGALTPEELAFLAGMGSRPCAYSPWLHPEDAGRRARAVLESVARLGVAAVGTDPEACFRRLLPAPESTWTR